MGGGDVVMSDPKLIQDMLPKTGSQRINERTYTIGEQIDCLKREIAHRENVYAKLVKQGDMQPQDARYQYDCMRAALATIKELQPDLFNQQ